jgi:hypothetical protein
MFIILGVFLGLCLIIGLGVGLGIYATIQQTNPGFGNEPIRTKAVYDANRGVGTGPILMQPT